MEGNLVLVLLDMFSHVFAILLALPILCYLPHWINCINCFPTTAIVFPLILSGNLQVWGSLSLR